MTSPIANALQAVTKPSPKRCTIGVWLDTLDADDRNQIAEACQPGRIHTVWKALRSSGVDVPASDSSWQRHWRGMCACPEVTA